MSIKLLTYRFFCIMMNLFMCNISLGGLGGGEETLTLGGGGGGLGKPSVPAHICIYP